MYGMDTDGTEDNGNITDGENMTEVEVESILERRLLYLSLI